MHQELANLLKAVQNLVHPKDYPNGLMDIETAAHRASVVEQAYDAFITKLRDQKQIVLSQDHWDCECKDNFIHPKHQHYCSRCGWYGNDPATPDSRLIEVLEMFSGVKREDW